ncbi:peptidase S8 and S53 subtilisin kexin sedolisin [Fictibacillus macauensis ZFHKF-1]|uniref:Peptidase S8 and S53 subtilisin kexin sedolisin n=1 Tax=Fictibacillus macauensis ZFHKF-1 TaxID=1196324 RepID=I8ALF5_9BACL|nr:S8 family serine peptidase [Fictibacillus macauensis]EIT86732.1 peptidase S8 and S53 subtilisin kexin sedolisin [Fictibacillus macauensis ZFHKF-1]
MKVSQLVMSVTLASTLAVGGLYSSEHIVRAADAPTMKVTASLQPHLFKKATKSIDMDLVADREIIVKVKKGKHVSFKRYGVKEQSHSPELNKIGIRIVRVSKHKNYEKTLRALQKDRAVVYAEPNYIRRASEETQPNDPLYKDQYALSQIKWSPTLVPESMSPVTVAVIDCGVDGSHPELAGKVLEGKDFIGTKLSNAHGTRVSGVIAATYNNKLGISGMNNNVRILPVRIGEAYTFETAEVAAGIMYAADHGANIINMSFAERKMNETEYDAILYAYQKGITLIAASGNYADRPVEYPAAYPEVIAVAATQKGSELSEATTKGKEIDLAAPGKKILLTTMGGGYATSSGTSYSSPTVAGLASMLLSKQQQLTPSEVEYLMEKGAYTPAAYQTSTGLTPTYGYGEINVPDTMNAQLPSLSDDVPSSPEQAQELTLGRPFRNKFDLPNDRDVYRLDVPKRKTVKIEVFPVPGMDPVLEIDGITYQASGSNESEVAEISLEAGKHTITVKENNGHWSEKKYMIVASK